MITASIEVEPLGDGVTINLPCRKLGTARRIGWLPIGFGIFLCFFMITWIATPMIMGIGVLRQGQMFGWLIIGFGCIGLVGLFHAIRIFVLGISILRDRTRCTVTVEDSKIVNREKFGWFSHKFKFKRSDIDRLFVVPITSVEVSSEGDTDGPGVHRFFEFLFGNDLHKHFAITPRKRGGKLIAAAYPEELLVSVATAIADELNRSQSTSVTIVRERVGDESAPSAQNVTVQHLSEEQFEQEEFSLPPGSPLEIIDEDGSVVVKVPQKSLREGSGGLFTFSLMWNGVLLFISSFLVIGGVNGGVWPMVLILGFFWIVGIGMLFGAFYMARQRAMIGVKDGLLFIERNTIFGTKWTEFAAEKIESIEMGHANMEVNGKPVMNLRITPLTGEPARMFSHLDNRELRWLAQKLVRALGIKPSDNRFSVANFNAAQPLDPPVSTDIETNGEAEQTTIFIPPRSFSGARVLQIIGLLFAIVSVPAAIALMFFFGAGFEVLMISIFLTFLGIGMLCVHRYATSRRCHILVNDQSIVVQVRGFFSDRDFELNRPEVLSVDMVDSGLKVDNQTMHCLGIKGTGGRGISVMTGRKQREITYVARLIHQRLKLTKPSST